MQAALQAQREGRILDALILLENAGKSGQPGADAEMSLLRASFLLQANQPAAETVAPLLGNPQYAADAYALTAMAYLQQGKMQEALDAARSAQASGAQAAGGGLLPRLALSYALQGMGRLAEARDVMHGYNAAKPQSAIALAREAELALTLNQVESARTLSEQAKAADATHPYVVAVSGLVYLIDGDARDAKAAFETALRNDPKDAKALFGLGLAEIKLGNLKAGQEKLQAAHEADPDDALVLTYLGRAQQQLGQTGAALASWRAARQADPQDPIPWLYQAQMELQANRPLEARESLRQAQARTASRSVYRGERLLAEDEQLLRANLAEIQRQLGMESMALQSLSDAPGEKSSANLRAQADLLQGQRFGESARRSLLLQSLFDQRPGSLPAELDIYGDGAGLTGAQTPQHGAVSTLNAQQASYNNYDSLFGPGATVAADGITGGQKTTGEQVRAGIGSDTLGLGIALRQYKTTGTEPIPSTLDNRIGQGIAQWRPDSSTQAFVSYQTFHSLHGETLFPADPINLGTYRLIADNSSILRLGLRQSLTDSSELRGLISRQRTDQTDNSEFISFMQPYSTSGLPGMGPTLPFPQSTQVGSSNTHSAELQYRASGADYATQWGAQMYRGPFLFGAQIFPAALPPSVNATSSTRQIYAARQQMLGPHWQIDAHLAWEIMDVRDNVGRSYFISLKRLLPQIGLLYTPDDATHVRLAAWRAISGDTVGDATLAPATVAGIVTQRPGERNDLVHSTALAADRQLSSSWLLEGQAQHRFADNIPQPGAGSEYRKQTDESRLALHWQAGNNPWAASLAYDYEHVQIPPASVALSATDSVQEQRLRSQQLDLRWFASEQITMRLAWSHNQASGILQSSDINFNSILLPFHESFNQADASLGWQFGKAGAASIGVRNATNKHFQYTDIDPLNPRFSKGRLAYGTLRLAF